VPVLTTVAVSFSSSSLGVCMRSSLSVSRWSSLVCIQAGILHMPAPTPILYYQSRLSGTFNRRLPHARRQTSLHHHADTPRYHCK